jgi:hypothetical protein
MAPAKSPTFPPCLGFTSSPPSLPTSMCLVCVSYCHPSVTLGFSVNTISWPLGCSRGFLGFTGSPFTVKISGEGRVKESITRTSRAPSVATVGSICDLNLKIPGGCRGLGRKEQWAPWGTTSSMAPECAIQVSSGDLPLHLILRFSLVFIFTEVHLNEKNLFSCYLFLLLNENSFLLSHG